MAQVNAPWFHSWYNPINKIIIKNRLINEKLIMFEIFIIKIRGINKVISTSKIKKITAIKKNWSEKGNRAEDFGSNPHSNGDLFSRSVKVFFEIKLAINITIILIKKIIKAIMNVVMIIYTNLFRSFDWKSKIIIILYKYLPHQ